MFRYPNGVRISSSASDVNKVSDTPHYHRATDFRSNGDYRGPGGDYRGPGGDYRSSSGDPALRVPIPGRLVAVKERGFVGELREFCSKLLAKVAYSVG